MRAINTWSYAQQQKPRICQDVFTELIRGLNEPTLSSVTLIQRTKENIHNRIFSGTHVFVFIVKVFVVHYVVRIADPFPNSSGL